MLGWVARPLATLSALGLATLGILSTRFTRAKLYFNLIVYFSILGFISGSGVFISVFAMLTGRRFNINYYVARSFDALCRPLLGIRMGVEGYEHVSRLAEQRGGRGEGAVLVGNHQSALDILFLGQMMPKRSTIMAKKELWYSPLLGQYLAASGAVSVDRKNRKVAMDTLDAAAQHIVKNGLALWVFPEGTRTLRPEPTLRPFKKGAFHLAVQAQIPIVPVVCENYHHLFDGKTRFDAGDLKIKVLPPISTAGLTIDDVNALTESTRELMLKTLIEISRPAPGTDKALEQLQHPETPKLVTALEEQAKQTAEGLRRNGGSGSETGTEDEMDEDAVLLKRPRGAAEQQPAVAP